MSTGQLIIIHLIELLAAIIGVRYIQKYREDKISRYFVWFLWFVVTIETFGLVPRLIKGVESLFFLKKTFFAEDNYWLYNPYLIVSLVFYIFFFSSHVKLKKNKNILRFLAILFFISAIVNLVFSKVFFEAISAYTFILGGVIIFVSIFLYFYEVFQSDNILYFNKLFPFYVAVGTLVFHLTVTPLLIYSKYYSESSNPEFVKIYTTILTIANVFMYTCYTIGFIVCYKKNNSYKRNRSYS